MKFQLAGSNLLEEDSRLELQHVIPGLTSIGWSLDDDAPVALCYGIPINISSKSRIVLRWDDQTSPEVLKDDRLRSIIFNTKVEMQRWLPIIPSSISTFVCNPPASADDPTDVAPTGIQSIRSSFDVMFLCASPEWCTKDSPARCAEAYSTLKKNFGSSCIIFMGNDPKHVLRGPDVFYVPWVDEKERAGIFSVSSFFLTSTTRKEVPIEVIESLSQGTPVLHFGQPGIAEVVGLYGHVWNTPRDIPKYPWDLSSVSPYSASKIFSDAFYAAGSS